MAEPHAYARTAPTLGADDPPPFEIVNPDAHFPMVLVCDHASAFIPARLDRLGLGSADALGHIAWDIGAATVTRRMAARFKAPAVLSGYSRLLIDCNRPPGDPSAIPEVSADIPIPGNRGLEPRDREYRRRTLFDPYHQAIAETRQRVAGQGVPPVLVSIHSFTPSLGGRERPWQVGVLWNRDPRLAVPAMDRLRTRSLCVGDNEPYSAREIGYTMDVHAGAMGLPHVTFEIRQDLVADDDGCARWADLLGDLVAELLTDSAIHRAEPY